MKLAVFSDVHANIHSLGAVLADIEQRSADVIWCGGDLIGYGANPGEVIETIQGRGIPTVMGNYDDAVGYFRFACGCDYTDEESMNRSLRSVWWSKEHTTDAQKAYLRSLPYRLQREIEGHQVVLVHGSPESLVEYLFAHKEDGTFTKYLQTTGADVLICGHTHKPYHKVIGDKHVINAGSAGKPKHGNPHATYMLIDLTRESVTAELIEVPYDVEAAARAIEATDLPHEFAGLLREGRG